MLEATSIVLHCNLSPRFTVPFFILQYADDTLVFSTVQGSALQVLHLTLRLFQLASGLHLNNHKSAFLPINLDAITVETVKCLFGFTTSSLPMDYLGLPLTLGRPDRSCFLPLLQKIESRLQGWKNCYLSRAGRLTLASSVLSAIPSYFMSVFLLPRWLIDAIDKARKRFIWGTNNEGKHRTHLVAWDKLCMPKEVGGLGIKNIKLQNQAFLLRWLWFLYKNHDSLWFRTTSKIYSPIRGEAAPLVWNKRGSFFWKDIHSLSYLFQFSTRLTILSGQAASFWYDNWAGKPLIPLLKGAHKPPRQRISYSRGSASLSSLLPMPWDQSTMLLLNDNIPRNQTDAPDDLCWRWKSDGRFSVSSFYTTISISGKIRNSLNYIWSFRIPPSLKLFLFLASGNRLLTQQQLLRRNLLALQPSCVLCNQCLLEDGLHLFFSCPFTILVWHRLSLLVTLPPLIESFAVREAFFLTLQHCVTDKPAQTLIATFFWTIWMERNNRIFRRKARDADQLSSWILCEAGLYLKFS
ncbi:RNA-directed DNA polymerase (reverse transcriptase)-related family protein [Rhynchospora pubera]|uniref:RNA-directed DNA polymerase (Reverse transcriptase)-related family protein n=1 Tax=Rhynchospora pubera TaxID=906938 RepID=A0AAV8HB03_9POAL|nr:RNA-directed DNA polymerase (reverse transcriptase)-related family protein [Rhynchospora pubera]